MGRIGPASRAALLSLGAKMSLEVKEMLTMTSVWLESGACKEGGNGKGKEQGKEEIISPKATSLCPHHHHHHDAPKREAWMTSPSSLCLPLLGSPWVCHTHIPCKAQLLSICHLDLFSLASFLDGAMSSSEPSWRGSSLGETPNTPA